MKKRLIAFSLSILMLTSNSFAAQCTTAELSQPVALPKTEVAKVLTSDLYSILLFEAKNEVNRSDVGEFHNYNLKRNDLIQNSTTQKLITNLITAMDTELQGKGNTQPIYHFAKAYLEADQLSPTYKADKTALTEYKDKVNANSLNVLQIFAKIGNKA